MKRVCLFLIALIFSLSVFSKNENDLWKKKMKIEISAVKKSKKYEQGEAIELILKVKNKSKDTIKMFYPSFLIGGGRWLILKNFKPIYSNLHARIMDDPGHFSLVPGAEKTFQIDPTLDRFNFTKGFYSIRVELLETSKRRIKSNRLFFKIAKIKEKDKEMFEEQKQIGYYSPKDLKRGLEFIKKYPTAHFTDEVILKTAENLYRKKRFSEAVDLLSKFDSSQFKTSQWQRNSAYFELKKNYEALNEIEKAIDALKKIIVPNRYYINEQIRELEKLLEK